MKYPFLYFLCSALIPKLRAYIAAGAAGNVHFRLITVFTVGTLPNKLLILFNNLYLSVIAAHLTKIALGVKLCVHDIIVNKFHNLHHSLDIIVHVGYLNIRYGTAR